MATLDDQEFHTHHEFPLSKGGSHRTDNLMYLCEACHQTMHRHKFKPRYERPNHSSESQIVKNLRLIEKAMSSGKLLQFNYRKKTGEISHRKVKPENKSRDKFQNKVLCLEGYCYLRKEKRVFAIIRMSAIKILDKSA